jgi:hypothetical protein
MGEGNPELPSALQSELSAARTRVAAAQAAFDAVAKKLKEFEQFGGHGDAVADDILFGMRRELEAANTELDNAQSGLANAELKATYAIHAARTAATPIDELLIGATETENDSPPTPAQGSTPKPTVNDPPPTLESTQPNEFEPRPLPVDEEPTPTVLQAAVGSSGLSRPTLLAIGGLAVIGVGLVGVLALNNGGPAGSTSSPDATSGLVASPTPMTTAGTTETTIAATLPPGAGAATWTLQGITGSDTGSWEDLASTAGGTLVIDVPQTVQEGQTYVITVTFSGTASAKEGWAGIEVLIQAGFADRNTSNGINPTNSRQVTLNPSVEDSIAVTAQWSPIHSEASNVEDTILIEASGGFSIAGTAPHMVATYVRAQ